VFRNPFKIGDKVLAARMEDGEDHEPGTVIDSYELLMGAESKPMVVVEFEDGEKKYLVGGPPNVLPAPVSEEDEEAEGEGEDDSDAAAAETLEGEASEAPAGGPATAAAATDADAADSAEG
jgi:hypothetical protein